MLKASDLFDLEPLARKEKIVSQIPNFELLNDSPDLIKSKATAKLYNSFIDDYFDHYIRKDNERSNGSLLSPRNIEELEKHIQFKIDEFLVNALDSMVKSFPTIESLARLDKNIYQTSGARNLSFGNSATRTISTCMGHLWEKIAIISPLSLSPEVEFGLKIKGVDLISKNIRTNKIEYQQLKTKKDTLTGSQADRSVSELSIHSNPVFCVALDNRSSWHFNDSKIPRAAGSDFWKRIGLPYNVILEKIKAATLVLDTEYLKIQSR